MSAATPALVRRRGRPTPHRRAADQARRPAAPALTAASDDADVLADAVAQILTRAASACARPSATGRGARTRGVPGTPEAEAVLRVGGAGVFQAAALFHDDVMDDPHTRLPRRAPGVRRPARPARAHGRRRAVRHLRGHPARRPHAHRQRAGVRRRPRPAADRSSGACTVVFDLMRTEVTVGQYLDVLAQALPWGDGARRDARPRGHPRQGRALQRRDPIVLGAALAGRLDELRRSRPTGCRWARRSSCETTCSACSVARGSHRQAGRRRPARGQADDAARHGGRPGPSAVRRAHRACCATASATSTSRRPTSWSSPTRSGARARPTTSRRSSTTSPAVRSGSWTTRRGPAQARQFIGLAHAAVDRRA